MESLVKIARRAWAKHEDEAMLAYDAFAAMCGGQAPFRVPGMDTAIRLAVRIHEGRSIEEAAGRAMHLGHAA